MKTRDEMNKMKTATGAANAIIRGLEAACDRDDAINEVENLCRLLLDLTSALIPPEGEPSARDERAADFLDGMAERLEEWAYEADRTTE